MGTGCVGTGRRSLPKGHVGLSLYGQFMQRANARLRVKARIKGTLYPLGVIVQSGAIMGIVGAADYGSGHVKTS